MVHGDKHTNIQFVLNQNIYIYISRYIYKIKLDIMLTYLKNKITIFEQIHSHKTRNKKLNYNTLQDKN